MEPRFLDVRKLAPPEPLERILDALTDMPRTERLWVLHRREPFPLYDLLRRMGYSWRTLGAEERFEMLIWWPDHPPTDEELAWRLPC